MLLRRLHSFLTAPISKTPRSQLIFWFSLSLAFAVTFGILGLQKAFSSQYVVQDDARQHVFWMQRFLDPELFPNDWIADYFQSVAPSGYAAFYQMMASLGLNPLLLNKLLPMVLGLITTGYCFGLCLEMLPVPAAGFITTLLLNQNLWLHDDLISGTARAFVYPLFLAFLYYLVRRSLLPCLIAIALQGLFYPQFVFIVVGILILRLGRWESGLHLSRNRKDYLFCATGLGVAFLVMLPYALETSEFGPVITAAAARTLPEFSAQGRSRFFLDNPWEYWLTAKRSGALLWVMPLCILSVLLLPISLLWPARFPLAKQVSHVTLLLQLVLVSLGMFLAAHAVLFRLYLPGRYMHSSLEILSALMAGIAVTVMLDGLFHWAEQPQPYPRRRQFSAIAATVLLGIVLVLSPELYYFPNINYQTGQVPSLYQFFAQQPKDTLIASLAREADNLPAFSQRSILVGREYSIPYHVGYYRPLRQRIIDLIAAQYSQNLAEVQNFIRTYGVNFWLIDRAYLLTPYGVDAESDTTLWIKQFQPVAAEAAARSELGAIPALASVSDRCSAFKTEDLIVLQATCILNSQE